MGGIGQVSRIKPLGLKADSPNGDVRGERIRTSDLLITNQPPLRTRKTHQHPRARKHRKKEG